MTNNLSTKRFAAYAAAEIGSQKRPLLINLLIIIAAAVVCYLMPSYSLLFGDTEISLMDLNSSHSFVMCFAAALSLSYICTAFRKFHRPLSAPFTMLVPASKSEKFAFAFLFNFVAMPAIFSLLDYLFFLFFSCVYNLQEFAIYYPSNSSSKGMAGMALLMFFFLGAVFFRRRQFINTALSALVIIVTLSMGLMIYLRAFGHTSFSSTFYFEFTSWIEITFWSLLTLGLLLWSWFRFKKLQIR